MEACNPNPLNLRINQNFEREGSLYIVKPVHNLEKGNTASGCYSCDFENEGGAETCPLSKTCMAHLRPDRQSVIYRKHKNS